MYTNSMFFGLQEAAITSAARKCFPNGIFFTCAKHDKDNLERRLTHVTAAEKKKIVEQFYGLNGWGPGGLSSCNSPAEFLKKKAEIDFTLLGDYFEIAVSYCENNMKSRLLAKGAVDYNWLSNAIECINFLVKLQIQWNPQGLRQMTNYLDDMAQFIMSEIMNCFHNGESNIALEGPLAKQRKFNRNTAFWSSMSYDDQVKTFEDYIKGEPEFTNVCQTKDKSFSCQDPGSVKQKLNHRKRVRASKTNTRTPKRGNKKTPANQDNEDTDHEEEDNGVSPGMAYLMEKYPSAYAKVLEKKKATEK